MMEESISSAATIPPMINKPLLASKLNAYQVEADKSGVPINLGFGLRMLEQINQHMPTIAIKGLKEINIPISSDVIFKYYATFVQVTSLKYQCFPFFRIPKY